MCDCRLAVIVIDRIAQSIFRISAYGSIYGPFLFPYVMIHDSLISSGDRVLLQLLRKGSVSVIIFRYH